MTINLDRFGRDDGVMGGLYECDCGRLVADGSRCDCRDEHAEDYDPADDTQDWRLL